MENLTRQAENKPTDLISLTAEIKFYVQQWGQNTIEIGKRLIAAKELVAHGEWGKWLEENFNLSQSTAQRFIKCAERFGKSATLQDLNYSQMVQLLSLSESETEKFIAEKSAEGKPVEEMTVKNLREEVAKWKADYDKQKSEVENLFAEKSALEDDKKRLNEERDETQKQLAEMAEKSASLQSENAKLQDELKNQKPVEKIVEKLPEDYEPLLAEKAELQGKIAQLEKELKEKPIEVQVPADYEKNKKQLAELQAQFEEMEKCAVIVQTLENISTQIDSIFYTPLLSNALTYYEKFNSVAYKKFVSRLSDFANNINKE